MKRFLALALLSATLFSATSGFAWVWVCTYQGPLGRIYQNWGHGEGRQAAKDFAKASCLKGKAHGAGPCVYKRCEQKNSF